MAENENKQENVVVEDFKRTNAKKSKKKFRHRQQNPVLAFYEDNKQYLLLFGVIVVALAAILVSILALKIPVVPVCLIIVLEAESRFVCTMFQSGCMVWLCWYRS